VKAEQITGQNQMSSAGDRQKLGEAFNDTENYRDKIGFRHAGSKVAACYHTRTPARCQTGSADSIENAISGSGWNAGVMRKFRG
jgi:hypothetical protein